MEIIYVPQSEDLQLPSTSLHPVRRGCWHCLAQSAFSFKFLWVNKYGGSEYFPLLLFPPSATSRNFNGKKELKICKRWKKKKKNLQHFKVWRCFLLQPKLQHSWRKIHHQSNKKKSSDHQIPLPNETQVRLMVFLQRQPEAGNLLDNCFTLQQLY